jgi:hypothetical protein
MKLRLHGTCAEVAGSTRRLLQVLEVVSVSQPYLDRGASVLVRLYLEVRLDAADLTRSTGTPPGRSPDPSRPADRRDLLPRGEVAGR